MGELVRAELDLFVKLEQMEQMGWLGWLCSELEQWQVSFNGDQQVLLKALLLL